MSKKKYISKIKNSMPLQATENVLRGLFQQSGDFDFFFKVIQDIRSKTAISCFSVNFQDLERLYKTVGLVKTIIELGVNKAFTFNPILKAIKEDESKLSSDDLIELSKKLAKKKTHESPFDIFKRLLWTKNLYGAALLVVDNGEGLREKLDIKKDDKIDYYVVKQHNIDGNDLLNENSEYCMITYTKGKSNITELVHKSRTIFTRTHGVDIDAYKQLSCNAPSMLEEGLSFLVEYLKLNNIWLTSLNKSRLASIQVSKDLTNHNDMQVQTSMRALKNNIKMASQNDFVIIPPGLEITDLKNNIDHWGANLEMMMKKMPSNWMLTYRELSGKGSTGFSSGSDISDDMATRNQIIRTESQNIFDFIVDVESQALFGKKADNYFIDYGDEGKLSREIEIQKMDQKYKIASDMCAQGWLTEEQLKSIVNSAKIFDISI